MPYVNVPRDITKVKTKLALGLTKRQMVCFGIAIGVSLPTFFLIRSIVGDTLAAIVMMIIIIPLGALALYEKDGEPLEKVVAYTLRQQKIYPHFRIYKAKSNYKEKEEVMNSEGEQADNKLLRASRSGRKSSGRSGSGSGGNEKSGSHRRSRSEGVCGSKGKAERGIRHKGSGRNGELSGNASATAGAGTSNTTGTVLDAAFAGASRATANPGKPTKNKPKNKRKAKPTKNKCRANHRHKKGEVCKCQKR